MESQIGQETFDRLRQFYGSHAEAAKALGISPRHYIRIRQSQAATPPLAAYIEMMAREASKIQEA